MMFIQTHHAYGTVPTFRALRRGEEVGARPVAPPPPPSCAATWTWPPRAWRGAARAAPLEPGRPSRRRRARLQTPGRAPRALAEPGRREVAVAGSPSACKYSNACAFWLILRGRGEPDEGFALKWAVKEKAKVRAKSREVEVCQPQTPSDSEDPGAPSWVLLDQAP